MKAWEGNDEFVKQEKIVYQKKRADKRQVLYKTTKVLQFKQQYSSDGPRGVQGLFTAIKTPTLH